MELRANNIAKLRTEHRHHDVLIIGGGINGAVSAAALAARGARVALIDRGDFGGETSSNSSNLAWGGIKYLENHEYLLVGKLCAGRNQLMKSYPSTVKETRFLVTVCKGFRHPAAVLYLGGLLYWMLGRFHTAAPRPLSRTAIHSREPVIRTDHAVGGFEYSDARFHDNDARFVFNLVRSGMNYGCVAANYVESTGAVHDGRVWRVSARDVTDGGELNLSASVLINACGPRVDEHNRLTGEQTEYRHIFSKGVHLVVDRLSREQRVLTFFGTDGRMFFAIPIGDKTLLGTTDTRVARADTKVTDEDRSFILDNINALLKLPSPITERDIIAERCGVRPLAVKGDAPDTDWTRLSRRHVIECNPATRHLSIFGGKLTDCINVGNEVSHRVRKLGVDMPYRSFRWYGEDHADVREEFHHQARLMELDKHTVAGASEPLTERLWRRYGGKALELLEAIRREPAQAERLMAETEYLRCELEYIARHEMVTRLEDFIRRRSKISQVVTEKSLVKSPGLMDVCKVLFGRQAEARYQEWLASVS